MQQITPKTLQQFIQEKKEFFLIDVREPFEHEHQNIGGSLLPLGEVVNHANEIPKNIPVIIYCRKGIRSQIAIQRLETKFGFTNLINLDGGIEAWNKIVV